MVVMYGTRRFAEIFAAHGGKQAVTRHREENPRLPY